MWVCVRSCFNVETHYEGQCQVRFQRGNSLGASVSVPVSAWQPSKRFCVGSGFNVETRMWVCVRSCFNVETHYGGLCQVRFQRGNSLGASVSVPVSAW